MDLSVIVPVYNDEEFLEKCIESIRSVIFDSKFSCELIVVNNGSDDSTCDIISAASDVKRCDIDRVSISAARNYGFKVSKGRFLAFIDSDVLVCPEWLEAFTEISLAKLGGKIVTGCTYGVRCDATWIERHWFNNLKSSHINGGNLIMSREAFKELGGFNESLKTGEDVDLCERSKSHETIQFFPKTGFKTVHLGYPRTISAFIKREFWHGQGDFYSFKTFIKSKVAMCSVVYVVAQALILLLAFLGYFIEGFFLLMMLLIGNFGITSLRFLGVARRSVLLNSVLNYFYFMARFGSLFKAIGNSRKEY